MTLYMTEKMLELANRVLCHVHQSERLPGTKSKHTRKRNFRKHK